MDAAVAKRKSALAARARDKLRKAVKRIAMIRMLGGNPAAAIHDGSAHMAHRRRGKEEVVGGEKVGGWGGGQKRIEKHKQTAVATRRVSKNLQQGKAGREGT